METPRSLLLITVDCLGAGHLGFMGYDRPTTPFLDSLAVDSLVLHDAIVAGSPTYYSFPTIMASRYPLALGRDVMGIAPHEPTIATALSQSGYATAAFTAANPYVSGRFGYDAGFDTFRDFLEGGGGSDSEAMRNGRARTRFNRRLMDFSRKFGSLGTAVYHELYFRYCQWRATSPASSYDKLRRFPAADVLVDHASDWLAGIAGKPFFLWLHFMDPHAPYYPGEEPLRLLGADPVDANRAMYLNSYWRRNELQAGRLRRHRDEVITLYDAGIRWVDEQISRLVGALRRLQLWDNCVAAFTADHGEEFLDHEGRYHSPPKVTEELIRVPLLLHSAGGRKQMVKTPFSFLDLAPTLLDAAGAQAPVSFRGHSRWKELQNGQSWDGTAIVECVASCTNPFNVENRRGGRILAVREGRYKLVLDFHAPSELFFDLENDPHELQPLPAEAQTSVRRRLLERAHCHLMESLRLRDPEVRLRARLRDIRMEWIGAAAQAAVVER